MKVILDEIFNENIKIINTIFLIIIVITIFHAYIYYIYGISLEKMKNKLMENITFNIVNKYLRDINDDFNLGNFTTLINEDVDNLSDYLMYGFFPILDFSIMLIVGFVYILFFSLRSPMSAFNCTIAMEENHTFTPTSIQPGIGLLIGMSFSCYCPSISSPKSYFCPMVSIIVPVGRVSSHTILFVIC